MFRSLDSIGIKTKKQAENRVYAALYHADGTLIGVRACDCNGTEQTLEFTVPGEA